MQLNYYDPKDPRKTGVWSDTVEMQPVRPAVLVDDKQQWLRTEESITFLCPIRTLRDYVRSLEARKMLDKIRATEKGGFWSTVGKTTGSIDGKWESLKVNTIRNLVMNIVEKDGSLKMGTNEKGGAKEVPDGKLAAHFLRGHAGSLAYTLHALEDAQWSGELHLDRARHTAGSFQKNYSRGLVERVRRAFRSHPKKKELRFEEAALL